jgi:pimeloyl-ACP methyl ester carboxylesterase
MFIQGENSSKPVLLFVHGGPGMPEYWLTQRYLFHLDELFTVAWWEQRGSGLSYEPGIPAKEMTSERFVADTLAVSNHLRDRSGTEKVYLMAHSWGSYIRPAGSRAGSRFVSRIRRGGSDHASDRVGDARL